MLSPPHVGQVTIFESGVFMVSGAKGQLKGGVLNARM